MTIFRVQHAKNYTVINNTICQDNRISWKAKGIWLYAFSRMDNWTFHLNDLINQSTDGRESVTTGLKELEKFGYLVRCQEKGEDGKYLKVDWQFFETPQELKKCLPETGNPLPANQVPENQPLISTDSLSSTEKKKNTVQGDSSLIFRKEKVFISEEDHLSLIAQHGKEIVEGAYTCLSEWKNGKTPKELGKSSDFGRIKKWAITAYRESQVREKELAIKENRLQKLSAPATNKEKSLKILSDYLIPKLLKIEHLSNHVEFILSGSPHAICINYSENGFEDQLMNAIRKTGCRKAT